MDVFMPLPTTVRHNKIIMNLIARLWNRIEKKELHALAEECSLVYWGNPFEISSLSLVNLSEIDDMQKFKDSVIEDLYCVQPDLMVFDLQPYEENKRQTKTAGQPDLVIEVWSDGNKKTDRDFKKYLYSTSNYTEHWYIEQDSNDIECYLGKERLPSQSLKEILRSVNGIEFDLRYLAL